MPETIIESSGTPQRLVAGVVARLAREEKVGIADADAARASSADAEKFFKEGIARCMVVAKRVYGSWDDGMNV